MLTTEEQERAAYISGDTDKAALLARVADLEAQADPWIEDKLRDDIADLKAELEDAEGTIEELRADVDRLQDQLKGPNK